MVSVPCRPLLWFLLACVSVCLLIPCCASDDGAAAVHGQKRDAPDIIGRALVCFDDRNIYSGCQGSFRLGPQGALNVPPGSADAFCGGPCLEEMELVLRCVDGVMGSFRFYNGATAADVRYALDRGCGAGHRGDFDVMKTIGAGGNYGDGYFYGGAAGTRPVVPRVGNLLAPPLLLGAAAAILAWA